MIHYRNMERNDAAKLAKLEKETFSAPWKEKDFLEMLEAPYAHYIIAEEEETLVGCCGIRCIAGEGEITNVAVKKEYRNRGIGTELLKKAIEVGKSLSIQAFTLEVRKSNEAAVHIYEKMGFRKEGVRKDFYEKPCEDAWIMWKV